MPPDQTFTFELDITTILSIIGSIELAIRHPKNTGPSATVAKSTARLMALALYKHWPDLPAELIRAWWHAGILPENLEDVTRQS